MPGFDYSGWQGFFMPKDTPQGDRRQDARRNDQGRGIRPK